MKDNGKGDLSQYSVEEIGKFVHSEQSMDKAFKAQDPMNAVRMMILSDEEFLDNAMRYDLPSTRMVLGVSVSIQECNEHGYQGGIDFYKYFCGLLPSKHGKRIGLFVDAIIGERKWKEGSFQGNGGGGLEKVKNFVTGKN